MQTIIYDKPGPCDFCGKDKPTIDIGPCGGVLGICEDCNADQGHSPSNPNYDGINVF